MSGLAYQLFGILHGSLGASVLALLALTVWVGRRGESASFGSGLVFCSMLQLLQAWFGLTLHTHYEGRLRRVVFQQAPSLAWWLERKEHLAVGAIVLTWCALAAHHASRRGGGRSQAYGRCASSAALVALAFSFFAFAVGPTPAPACWRSVAKRAPEHRCPREIVRTRLRRTRWFDPSRASA
jgi:hypothetical protein